MERAMSLNAEYHNYREPTVAEVVEKDKAWSKLAALDRVGLNRLQGKLERLCHETIACAKGKARFDEWHVLDDDLCTFMRMLFAAMMEEALAPIDKKDYAKQRDTIVACLPRQMIFATSFLSGLTDWNDLWPEGSEDPEKGACPFPKLRKLLLEKICFVWAYDPQELISQGAFEAILQSMHTAHRSIAIDIISDKDKLFPINTRTREAILAAMNWQGSHSFVNVDPLINTLRNRWMRNMGHQELRTLVEISHASTRGFSAQGSQRIVEMAERVARLDHVAYACEKIYFGMHKISIVNINPDPNEMAVEAECILDHTWQRRGESIDVFLGRYSRAIEEKFREWENPDPTVTVFVRTYLIDREGRTPGPIVRSDRL